jgi:hypothetical protein
MSWNPYDYNRGAPGVRIGTQRRSPNDPDSGNPQGARGVILWLLLIFLIGVLPAGALIYWGYFTPFVVTCGAQPLYHGQVCDYNLFDVNYQYTYAQAIINETWRQWIERVIGVVWALLTVRFVAGRLRRNATEQAPAAPEPGSGVPSDASRAYRRGRLVSALTTIGIVLCALGVVALAFIPPGIVLVGGAGTVLP